MTLAAVALACALAGLSAQASPAKKGLCGPNSAGPGHSREHCDRSCMDHDDCKFTCGCGALSRNENCDDQGIIYDCVGHEVACEKRRCVALEERPPVRQVRIVLDKQRYVPGEPVKVAIVNGREHVIMAYAEPQGPPAYYGDSYGIGFIQKMEDGAWLDIEPLWRCGGSCFKECKYKQAFKPGESREFVWGQTRLICDKTGRKEKTVRLEEGRYRVKTRAWLGKDRGYRNVYSPEFEIHRP